MLTVISFLLVLSFLIFVHELGHYTVAKLSGIEVERFSIGMPPRLFGVKVGETDYCISAIPMGGYVTMLGQSDFAAEEDNSEIGPRDFRGKPTLVKMAVLVAGSFMNLMTAVLLFTFLFWSVGAPVDSNAIGYVEPGSPAAEAGLDPGDRILTVNGGEVHQLDRDLISLYTDDSTTMTVEDARTGNVETVTIDRKLDQTQTFGLLPYTPAVIDDVLDGSPADQAGLQSGDDIVALGSTDLTGGWYHMSSIVRKHPNEEMVFRIRRDGNLIDVPVQLGEFEQDLPDGGTEIIGRAGITPRVQTRDLGFGESIVQGINETRFIAIHTLDFFVKLVTGRMSTKLLGGPVLIAQMAGESAASGLMSLLSFTAFISINLGVLNLLPFPVLDGGHVFILATETITRRKLSQRVRLAIQQVGSIILLLFMIYVTFNDLMRVDTISQLFGG